ncbi:MFS transporter [Cohnella sp. F6_2S_P_1]|uniref:MFS transporter n=1 Tax=Cohnella hashimotonis TaxID=2826895 RepID=A0ABT6TC21_9BACL|nr:MFS transporter [Cohnella hashimotonis]MDI4644370.1 MFS transporter [Cohnella hashimotonis]
MDDKKAIRAWTMYDWANSSFATTIMAAVMPIYYAGVAASGLADGRATSYWGFTQTAAAIIVAVLSPLLGAIADRSGGKKRFLGVFTLLGAAACIGMAFIGEGDWLAASALVIVGMMGFGMGGTFYDALLNDVASPAMRERVSAKGFAMGYLGGGVLLAVNLALIIGYKAFGFKDSAGASQVSFAMVGVWWALFSLPLFKHVREAKGTPAMSAAESVREGLARLGQTFRSIRRYPELFKFMVAYWFFFDGINTIIVMATSYGTDIGLEQEALIGALLLTQFVGFPATWLFGRLADRIGGKKMLYGALSVYVIIVLLGYFMTNEYHFFALALLVGLVQGGAQSTSRAIYSRLIPPGRTAEFNGFLSFTSRFFSFGGPLVFGVVGVLTGSSRAALLAIALFFLVGIALLALVKLEKGWREATE